MHYSLLAVLGAVRALADSAQIPVANSPAPAYDAAYASAPAAAGSFECVHPAYKAHLVSRSPLVIYLEDFITPAERALLLAQANASYVHSNVAVGNSSTTSAHRTSSSASLSASSVVSCIHARALSFQDFALSPAHLEPLQLVRYATGQHYHYHTDWFSAASHSGLSAGGNRASSFFGYVKVTPDVTGGGTNFPVVTPPRGDKWCRFIDCDEEWTSGTTFRPIEGNAVYWENLVEGPDGVQVGDHRTLHAGLPVTSGEKVGMNIWTRQAPLGDSVRQGL
ncbi:hypothetical protein TD95_001634 [Thielaviopsis punctulata]|uniref:Fe2OG dioxygenase domain-containing protein n=1 Tax=Thielaviopsis punctulata TaxID=72032 RepID=A0A0F4Z867_9PEZI|nr:hypothetical protein TD95_001634 [Thielaviopsis punctulata]